MLAMAEQGKIATINSVGARCYRTDFAPPPCQSIDPTSGQPLPADQYPANRRGLGRGGNNSDIGARARRAVGYPQRRPRESGTLGSKQEKRPLFVKKWRKNFCAFGPWVGMVNSPRPKLAKFFCFFLFTNRSLPHANFRPALLHRRHQSVHPHIGTWRSSCCRLHRHQGSFRSMFTSLASARPDGSANERMGRAGI